MSWGSVRSAVVSAIEALTPTTTAWGEPKFVHVDAEQIEESAKDRAFAVRMTVPPTQVGQILNGSSWRWLTSFEVSIRYNHGRLVEEDEDRIEQDVRQIQQTLLTASLHANVEGFVPLGDGYCSVTISEDGSRNYLVGLNFTMHHL